MAVSSNGQPATYRLLMSAFVKAAIKQRHLEAAETGRGHEFISSLRQIIRRLQQDPLVFGEVLYWLKAVPMQACLGAIAPIVVTYAVHEEKKLVFMQSVRLLS